MPPLKKCMVLSALLVSILLTPFGAVKVWAAQSTEVSVPYLADAKSTVAITGTNYGKEMKVQNFSETEEGAVSMKFDEPGTYVFEASCDTSDKTYTVTVTLFNDDNGGLSSAVVISSSEGEGSKPEIMDFRNPSEPTYTITYDTNGGVWKDTKTDELRYETNPISQGTTIKEAPEREGYTFLYWKGSLYYPGDSYNEKNTDGYVDDYLVAQWEKNVVPEKTNTNTVDVPKTGDNMTLVYAAIGTLSLVEIIALVFLKRKKKEESNIEQ